MPNVSERQLRREVLDLTVREVMRQYPGWVIRTDGEPIRWAGMDRVVREKFARLMALAQISFGRSSRRSEKPSA